MKTKRYIPEWVKKYIHANKGKKGVRVYYLMRGVDVVCSDIAVNTTLDAVEFADGAWCARQDCYLTAEQCRQASGLWLRDALTKARQTLEKAGTALDEADMRLAGMQNSLEETQ